MSTQQSCLWHPGIGFLRAAAVCSLLSAFTTLVLILLPTPSANGFESQLDLHANNQYLFRTWIYWLHPQLTLVAVIGTCLVKMRRMPGIATTTLVFFLIWAQAEAMQQSLAIDALNQFWRPTYLATDSEITRRALESMLVGFDGLYDSYYFLLLHAFGVGSSLMALVLFSDRILDRVLAFCFLFFGVLSLLSFCSYYLHATSLSGITQLAYAWIYPWLQPLARAGLAIFLWQCASKHRHLAHDA